MGGPSRHCLTSNPPPPAPIRAPAVPNGPNGGPDRRSLALHHPLDRLRVGRSTLLVDVPSSGKRWRWRRGSALIALSDRCLAVLRLARCRRFANSTAFGAAPASARCRLARTQTPYNCRD